MSAMRNLALYAAVVAALVLVGLFQSWNLALSIFIVGLISAIMSLGLNIQWGYAGLFNVAIMGFVALGGLAVVLVSEAPVDEAWAAGGVGIALSLAILLVAVALIVLNRRLLRRGWPRALATTVIVVAAYIVIRNVYGPAVSAIEAVHPAQTGYLGGAGLPVILSWAVGGVFAAAAAWLVGKIALGLKSDYLAIATLGISAIIVAVLKNEDWLDRGVKNVTGLSRPVPVEVNLQHAPWFLNLAQWFGADPSDAASVFVKLCYAVLFIIVLAIVMWLSERALNSPWGRMMRAIRDNSDAAEAMGKNVTARHLQVFVLGSAVVGVAGAMLITLDGQFTPISFEPLRYTFVIWVMAVVGGSGNNWGAVIGAFVIWIIWIEAAPIGIWLMHVLTSGLSPENPVRMHLMDAAPHMRLFLMGLILLLVLRFSPRGLIPERSGPARERAKPLRTTAQPAE